MNYEIHVKQVAPQTVVTERKHTPLADIGEVLQSTLAAISDSVRPAGATRGVPFAIYHNEPFTPDDVDVEVGLAVAADARVEETAGVHRRELPGGAVAYAVHLGSYSAIGAAYRELYEWVLLHGHKPLGPPREIYLVGPGPGVAREDYRTEIDVPID